VCHLLAFGQQELAALLEKAPRAYIGLLLAAGLALAPVIRRFISLGLNRVWLNSGDTIYRRVSLPSFSMASQ
jgi:lysophospholipid hydrolase